jgi:predicted Zn finger-like uncharacterized protein
MPIIVACPSCGGKLRVADTLVGQRVRCPACNHAFVSAAESPPPTPPSPAPQELPLQLSLDDPSSPPPPIPSRNPGGLFGAVEIKRPGEVEPTASPPSKEEPAEPPRRTKREGDWDVPDIRRLRRRDAEPDRGAIVLALGIISLAGTVFYCAAPMWVILGAVAWIMGQTDLRKMKSGLMDDNGHSITKAGWICGILGVVLNGLLMLTCGTIFGIAWYAEMSRPPNTTPFLPPPPPKMAPPPAPKPPPMKRVQVLQRSSSAAPLTAGSYGFSHWMISMRLPSGSKMKKRSAPGMAVVS